MEYTVSPLKRINKIGNAKGARKKINFLADISPKRGGSNSLPLKKVDFFHTKFKNYSAWTRIALCMRFITIFFLNFSCYLFLFEKYSYTPILCGNDRCIFQIFWHTPYNPMITVETRTNLVSVAYSQSRRVLMWLCVNAGVTGVTGTG